MLTQSSRIVGALCAGATGVAISLTCLADEAAGGGAEAVGTIPLVVISTTPLPGATIDADKVPANVETLTAADLSTNGTANLTGTLSARLGSINVNDTLADPFQSDILYRGFEASPVLGTPQGLAVYQNGVRINEAFGDAVNWDLIPDIAVDRIDFVSANPVYGLNALGGSASVTMKNGFSYQGGEGEFSGGSFHQRTGSGEFGANNGTFAVYAAARVLNQEGWRFFAADSIHQFFVVLSARGAAGTLDLSFTHADNRMFGQGAAPVQSLALSTEEIFTGPQNNINRLDFVTLNGTLQIASGLTAQANAYYRHFRQNVSNGNTTNYTACTTAAGAGFLCQSDGATPLTNQAGQFLPDLSDGGTVLIGENDFETIDTYGRGGTLQFTASGAWGGLKNQLTAGASADTAAIDFYSGAQIGVIDQALTVLPSNLDVFTPEGPVGDAFGSSPTVLAATNDYYGFYLTDTLDITQALSVTASGRYNIAKIDLDDRQGTDLNGLNRYTHFNPAIGATYKLSGAITAYGGYSVTNRTPDASEIECSDPLLPCLLPANLAGDPPGLKQVIAHTYELGLRGHLDSDVGPAASATDGLYWHLGVFRTNLDDDIYAISTSVSTGFFQNIGSTRRQGVEAGMRYRWSRGLAYLDYSYIDATFRSALVLNSPSSPAQDANGNIQIEPGDHLPLIPDHRIKAGIDYNILPAWTAGVSFVLTTDQYYKGDESNQEAPMPGYHIFGLHTSYRFGRHAEVFLSMDNVFNERYATYGIYSDPTGVNAPGVPPDGVTNGPGVDNRFLSPGEPRAFFGGVRISF